VPVFRAISLRCNITEDNLGPDEAYLTFQGQRLWGPDSINDTESVALTGLVRPIRFIRAIRVELYDQDAGWFDDDDFLGRLEVMADHERGEHTHTFNGDGANYDFTYAVL
jgi:hypothetical protein